MITLKNLVWNNVFSYGTDNELELNANPITQLVGFNGHGKSSIPLIIEESFYNKNSKGIKRSDILNRYVDSSKYSIQIDFDKDGIPYRIYTVRGATQTVKLFKDGVDISAHTSTNTYKLIEDILGFDAKTFAQLIYQSSSSSLEFLTATDTNRKKFLIDLLGLGRYTEAFEVFKALAKQIQEEVTVLETKAKTTEAWLAKHSTESLELKVGVDVPAEPTHLNELVIDLRTELSNIDSINKVRTKNNQYKLRLDSIVVTAEVPPTPEGNITKLVSEKAEAQKTVKDATSFITKMRSLKDSCPTCLQAIDSNKVAELVSEKESEISRAEGVISSISEKILELEAAETSLLKYTKNKQEWEEYHALFDPNVPVDLLDKEEVSNKITALQNQFVEISDSIKEAREINSRVEKHNSRVEVISQQLVDMQADLDVYVKELTGISDRLTTVQLLQKTFSTNGLVAYKIECLIKDLESLVNEYLSELSDGRFQLLFKVSGSDKLNVIITDNGNDVDIFALSSGERARVNTATLLAIRKLMQSLSNARINLLILDETIDTLDSDGKERLVEVLLKEDHLNTFLISHSYSHPLIEKIHIIKENNISRIEK